MRIVAILQARFSSSRLPGKVLLPLKGSTVLGQVVERVRQAKRLDAIWLATSTEASDDAVAGEAKRQGVPCFRGSLPNVLDRYHGAAAAAQADVIVRVTCDCPLFDGPLLDRMIARYLGEEGGQQFDYLSNVIKRTYPKGLDAEIFSRVALERAHREAISDYDREHVTPYFYRNPGLFTLGSFTGAPDRSTQRWTLDTAADWDFVRAVYDRLHRAGTVFTTAEICGLIEREPEIADLNREPSA